MSEIERLGLQIKNTLDPAPTVGDARLIERLITNLIENAVRHNTPGGHVEIATGTRHQHSYLAVSNSGLAIPPSELERASPSSKPSPQPTT